MKLVDKFFKPKNTYDMTEWIKLADFLGIDKKLDRDERSEATYFACLKILSEAVGKLPLKLLQQTKKNGVIEARKHPLYNLLRNRPNRYMTSTIFKSTIEQLRNHYGNAFVYISGYGKNMQLIPLDSSQVEIWYDDGKLLSEIPDIWYIYSAGGQTYKFSSEEILHFKTSTTFDGIKSLSVREICIRRLTETKKHKKCKMRYMIVGLLLRQLCNIQVI